MSRRRYREIRNLFLVIIAAVVCACLLSLLMISSYGPSGRYIAGSALFNPMLMETARNESNGKSNQKSHLEFDRIEFTYLDAESRQMERRLISPSIYQEFYTLIATERSLEVSDKLRQLFTYSPPAVLTLTVDEGNGSKIFQVIQFVKEDEFRVQLHEQRKEGDEWAYFSHPGLYQKIMKLFTSKTKIQV